MPYQNLQLHSAAKKSILLILFLVFFSGFSQDKKEKPKFKVIAFYTAKNDQAHISFVHEANKWFPKEAEKNHFVYDSTDKLFKNTWKMAVVLLGFISLPLP